MNTLKKKIKKIIIEKGPISIAEFMKISLTDPKNGYYRKRMPLGSKGDFITYFANIWRNNRYLDIGFMDKAW